MPGLDPLRLTPRLTPHGRLTLAEADDAALLEAGLAERLSRAFTRGSGHGLLRLGAAEVGTVLPPSLGYWRELGARYVTALCTRPEATERLVAIEPPPDDELDRIALAAPPMPGAEYVSVDVLRSLWAELGTALDEELAATGATVPDFLKGLDPAWNVVGRVHFNLAENRKDATAPFAFLATYTDRLSAHGKAQHLPLGQALRDYASESKKDRLLSLLVPVQRAAERCTWLKELVASGSIFHPLRWAPDEALQLLRDVPALERAGVIVRMPATWKAGRPPRPQVTATVGARPAAGLGVDALLDFSMAVTLDGETLSPAEMTALLEGASGLSLIRGQWVEVDRERLGSTMTRFQDAKRLAAAEGLSFAEAMRMLAGAPVAGGDDETADTDWSRVVAGPWLAETLRTLRAPDTAAQVEPGPDLHATLRPYQQVGVRWLHLLSQLGLGACLADDMGLGKTIQVLALLLAERRGRRGPSLLVAPASLLANWAGEVERFTPDLRVAIAHGPAGARGDEELRDVDLVITSYGTLLRAGWLSSRPWNLVILDEAQAIKNPGAKQTQAAKKVRARARIALTGTPIENRLGDLWSIFDFLNPGLLGSAKAFTTYTKRLASRTSPFAPLRELVRPYLLRRLKTDRSVISDLPDKTEVAAYCQLSKRQAALYQEAVDDLAARLENADGIQRRGVVLASLVRMKQVCNHPSQWLGDGAWRAADSGKWARLRELCEVIAARQEKALVFTQFREITDPLAAFLGEVFGQPGLVLHGGTPVARRQELVRRFQDDESVPFFLLSLKAGGSGLNLTAASHVVHFDRWWNPAVENQATDRAFRIGQRKNVMVHKFVCRGTVEEKIDRLIESKKKVSQEILEGGAEVSLTELGDAEILKLVALDLDAAMKE